VADETLSWAEVAARLSARAAELAGLEQRLGNETITIRSKDGRLRIVVTGTGQPVSLHIDQAAVEGTDHGRLGPLVAELIMVARRRAAARREELGTLGRGDRR
jgi:DNA-binding protein YbaB